MTIFERLSDPQSWDEFLLYKVQSCNMPQQDEADLARFIAGKEYLPVLDKIERCEFPPPSKSLVAKMGSDRKRVVYRFPKEENLVLKFLTFLLIRKYEHLFAPNLYSFRAGHGVSKAVKRLKRDRNLPEKFVYKVDLHDYFNSVDISLLFPILDDALGDEPAVLRFIKSVLANPAVKLGDGSVTEEKRGIMAGVPLSAFLANLFLSEIDWHFHSKGTQYLRYSDDIILLGDSRAQLEEDARWLHDHIDRMHLAVNHAKEQWSNPGEEWTFLGIKHRDGTFDISDTSVKKICGKMRRKCRALIRWRHRRGVPPEKAARKFVAVFNRKLYENRIHSELTWTRWFFPLINTADGLRRIDRYMQQCVRHIMTETRTARRYRFTYGEMRALGYRSLVHEYYRCRQDAAAD